ncbi:MAG: PAS domain-containing protein [Candidatus Adiutrix sp.]|jgi:two-component system phosphate regulon sensor histidine kinase PhoR|nr:PAS domain-containing protein [Candidatus Adiutrix sp.]
MISRSKMFALVFLPAAAVLVFALALIQQKNLELGAAQTERMMKNQWFFVSLLMEGGGKNFQRLAESAGLRVTLVDPEGKVLFDTEVRDITESHKDREEIRNALLGVPTLIRRGSRTTRTLTIYYAEALPDARVLRVAYPAEYFDEQPGALLTQTLAGLMALAGLAALFALVTAKRFGAALDELGRAVSDAQSGGTELASFDNESLDRALYSLSAAVRELKSSSLKNAEINARLDYILNNISEGVILFEGDHIIYHNQRAREILNSELPAAVSQADRPELITVLKGLTSGAAPELRLGGQIVAVDRAESGSSRLALLHDISDREKYSGYKSELVGNVSHELKTPLTLIMAAAEVLVKDPETPRPVQEKFLNTIYKNAHRLDALLEDLIFLHKLESLVISEPTPVNLEDILAEIKDLADPGDKEVLYDFDSGPARIHGTHLISLLTNLIGNAVKYSTGRTVRVAARKTENALEIEVADEGPAIPAGERERIFERFYSLSESRNRGQSGSGLGLAIVKHIARQYNGRALVAGNESGGNTFRVTLAEK